MKTDLLKKYNVAGPRYTSYPAMPYWDTTPTKEQWFENVKMSFDNSEDKGISIYIHLPYCEEFCTYCACNKIITKNHSLEDPYIKALLSEWKQYKDLLVSKPLIREIHLGGGTPTYFSANNLHLLISSILEDCLVDEETEMSIEIHPNVVNYEQLHVLKELGFTRVSLGIQDFDPVVQKAINREQSFSQVRAVTEWARELGYKSVNFDLIYGLPFQTEESIKDTIDKVSRLMPERIAFYSYAHVPWKKNAQRLFTDEDLPTGEEKLQLYETGRFLLMKKGYEAVGMDHFALENDDLFQFYKNGKLHRNFMGYTVARSEMLIGLGMSSISEAGNMYVQNEKNIKKYEDSVNGSDLPIIKGHILTTEDEKSRNCIMDLMCHFEAEIKEVNDQNKLLNLSDFEEEGILKITDKKIIISDLGKSFVRNVCMTLDDRHQNYLSEKKMFSQTI